MPCLVNHDGYIRVDLFSFWKMSNSRSSMGPWTAQQLVNWHQTLIQQQRMETRFLFVLFLYWPFHCSTHLRVTNITNISCSFSTFSRTKDAGTVWVWTIFRPYLNLYALLCHVHVAEGVGGGGGGGGQGRGGWKGTHMGRGGGLEGYTHAK